MTKASDAAFPEVAGHDTWLDARKQLLAREKELSRQLDELSIARRELPMVRVEQDYRFEGPDGEAGLLDLFGDHPQLIVQHFMFDPEWDDACQSCSRMAAGAADPAVLAQLASRSTAFAAVSRAPLAKLEAVRAARGWEFPWYSSYDSEFNYDFHVSLDPARRPANYNFRDADELEASGEGWMTTYVGEQPGISCFLRRGDEIFHTYSTYGRGVEVMLPAYRLLDITPLGRQEPWEQPSGRAPALYRSDETVLSPDIVGADT